MTIRPVPFTPEVLLSAPRRSAGVPNSTGDLVLYTISAYSFESHSKTSQIRVLNLRDGSSHLVSEESGASEPVWISEKEVAFLKPAEQGCTILASQNVLEKPVEGHTHMIHYFTGSISNPKTKVLASGKVAFVCSALTTPQGDMFWPAAESRSHSSAKVYSSLFVRHWDSWCTENQNSLWYGQLSRKDGKWILENGALANLLGGTRLSSPPGPFGGTGDFDIASHGIAFVARDPSLNPARYTKSDVYYAPLASFTSADPVHPQVVKTGTLRGFSASPTFSNDGSKLAFTRMRHQQYESDKTRLMLIPDIRDLSHVQEFYATQDGAGRWDLRPEWIVWSPDDRELYVAAEQHGRTKLWTLPSSPREADQSLPEALFESGSLVEAHVLASTAGIFLSCRSRIENSCYCILDRSDNNSLKEVSSSSNGGKSFGLKPQQQVDMWYAGSRGYDNHALVMTPSHFDKSKKYPLALLIHGGPQSAWSDDWSTRWNPAVFAEQGYVVVCPNPTGSTGYGQDHIDAIAGNWGGSPYQDLVKCFEHLETVDYVDTTRAVALGASYGGYMINWIQGQPLGRKFKAFVCHDGVFSTQNMWSTEELFFPEHEFEGSLWENREAYKKWDPSSHTGNWNTPTLVIHNELDYRLPVSEGLAMFNVLQARGIPSKLVVFPDENHWVLKPENSLVWHREVLGWINYYSGLADEAGLQTGTEKLTV